MYLPLLSYLWFIHGPAARETPIRLDRNDDKPQPRGHGESLDETRPADFDCYSRRPGYLGLRPATTAARATGSTDRRAGTTAWINSRLLGMPASGY